MTANALRHIRNRIRERPPNAESPPFSARASEALKTRVSDYIERLVGEAEKICRRDRADVISAAHVQQASEYLVTPSRRGFIRHAGTLGGILLGAAISNFLSMTTVNQYSPVGVAFSALLAVLGAFGVAYPMGKE